MRSTSVPPQSLTRLRTGSVPPQSHADRASRASVARGPVSALCTGGQRSGVSVRPAGAGLTVGAARGASAYRRASIAVPSGLSIHTAYSPVGRSTTTPSRSYPLSGLTTTRSFTSSRASSPIHSYSPTRGSYIVQEQRSAPQRPPSGASRVGSYRATAYYRAPAREGASPELVSSPRRVTTSYGMVNKRMPFKDEFEDNGLGYSKIKIQPKEKVEQNGYGRAKISYDFEPSPFLPNQKESLSDLRSRTNVARDQLSRHRILLDRYLPISMDRPNEVEYEVENKYGELVSRMPQLEYRHRTRSRLDEPEAPPLLIEPYRPAARPAAKEPLPSISLPPVRNSFTPVISDTRKRARSVLCKIKNDPRYFDFS